MSCRRTGSEGERVDPHPVVAAFMQHEESRNFAREEVRAAVIPAYMGLIKQLDDHLGRLFSFLETRGLMENTLIVVTSDHGDYLGDHWLGEKELFHEESVHIPLIVCDPSVAADATRGTVDAHLVEAIDLAPTFVEAAGGTVPNHILEGRSLVGLVRGEAGAWRDAAVSECDYSFRKARLMLGREPGQSRAYMVRTERWKYVEYDGFRPQLFDLAADPRELNDLGADPAHEGIRGELRERLFAWLRDRRMRVTMSDAEVAERTDTHMKRGYIFGVW